MEEIIKILRDLECNKQSRNRFGIITPFKAQKEIILKEIETNNLEGIKVGTTESFQGDERDVILISTTRQRTYSAEGEDHIGFLGNPKRLNVLLSRAKVTTIIVGNPHVLRTNENWRKVINHCHFLH